MVVKQINLASCSLNPEAFEHWHGNTDIPKPHKNTRTQHVRVYIGEDKGCITSGAIAPFSWIDNYIHYHTDPQTPSLMHKHTNLIIQCEIMEWGVFVED